MVSTPIDDTEDMRQNISALAHPYKPHSLPLSLSLLLLCFILSTPTHNRLYLSLFRLHISALNDSPTSLYRAKFVSLQSESSGQSVTAVSFLSFAYAHSFVYKYVFCGFLRVQSMVTEVNSLQNTILENYWF